MYDLIDMLYDTFLYLDDIFTIYDPEFEQDNSYIYIIRNFS